VLIGIWRYSSRRFTGMNGAQRSEYDRVLSGHLRGPGAVPNPVSGWQVTLTVV
jgi:hypothetical protein